MVAPGSSTILVADDQEPLRKDAVKRLNTEGYLCIEAGDAAETSLILRKCSPEAILLDAELPGTSGNSLLRRISANNPKTAVIVMAPATNSQHLIECIKSGAKDFVTKPLDLDQLVLRVTNAIELKRDELQTTDRQKQLEKELLMQKREIRGFFMKTIEALIHALEAKDKYTAGHSQRVTDYALFLGGEVGLSRDQLDELCYGALLHDIGKIGVDASIQNKTGHLSQREYRHIMTHATIGPDIVRPVVSQDVIEMITHHHDRFDGSGQNQKTRGAEIPIGARIIAIADAFDAMTSERPYRAAMPPGAAMAEIQKCSGTQFDPVLVGAFHKLLIGTRVV